MDEEQIIEEVVIPKIRVWDKDNNLLVMMDEEKATANSARFYVSPDTTAIEALAEAGTPVDLSDYKLSGSGSIVSKTATEKQAAIDAQLAPLKASLVKRIDEMVAGKIAEGSFEHPASSGNLFSITTTAQVKWIGLYSARDLMVYPMKVYTKDDSTEYSIADAAEVAIIYGLAVGTVRALLDAATDAKTATLAAADADGALAAFEAY